MDERNVEFEYQVRRTLRDALNQTAPNAPEPGPVEAQSLDSPGAAPAAPAASPAASPASDRPDPPVSMSPRPADLGTLPVPRAPGAPTPLAPTPLAPR